MPFCWLGNKRAKVLGKRDYYQQWIGTSKHIM
jgi:hypothetical protein